MVDFDPNVKVTDSTQLQGGDAVKDDKPVEHHKGVGGDQGGQDVGQKKEAEGHDEPPLPDPDGNLTPQSYNDAADAFSDVSITEALIAVAQAANEDRASSNKEQLDDINASYQDSMDAVSKMKDKAQDDYSARMIKDGTDIGQNAANAIGSGIATKVGSSDAKIMGANQAVGAGSGAVGDVGDMFAAGVQEKADLEKTDADTDNADATKDSAYAQKAGDHASFNSQMLSLAIQIFQQKAEAELQTGGKLSNYS